MVKDQTPHRLQRFGISPEEETDGLDILIAKWMSIQFRGDVEIIGPPFLVTSRLLGVRSESVPFDAFNCQPRYIFEGNMQHCMLRHRGVTISHHPLLVELGGFLVT